MFRVQLFFKSYFKFCRKNKFVEQKGKEKKKREKEEKKRKEGGFFLKKLEVLENFVYAPEARGRGRRPRLRADNAGDPFASPSIKDHGRP